MRKVEATDSDATSVCGLSLPIARESHDGGGEGDDGEHAPPSLTLSPFSRRRRTMGRRGPDDSDWFLLLSPTSPIIGMVFPDAEAGRAGKWRRMRRKRKR